MKSGGLIIVRFVGGLGNQMYQYALYKKLESLGHTVRADLTYFTDIPEGDTVRPYELNVFEDARVIPATQAEINAFKPVQVPYLAFIINRLRKIKGPTITEQPPYLFNPELFTLESAYLNGFWQTPQYFEDIADALRQDFTFKPSRKPENRALLEELEQRESVGVHIRRGDYLKLPELYGGVCTDDYYGQAMGLINQRVQNPHFFFFSDDPEWVKTRYQLDNMTVVDYNQTDEQHYDMCLMSRCRHNIIANSSFSWWAAWLNQNPGKVVVSPACQERGVPIPDEKRVAGWQYLDDADV